MTEGIKCPKCKSSYMYLSSGVKCLCDWEKLPQEKKDAGLRKLLRAIEDIKEVRTSNV